MTASARVEPAPTVVVSSTPPQTARPAATPTAAAAPTPRPTAGAQQVRLVLKEMVDAVPPIALDNDPGHRVDILAGWIILREDSTFTLHFDMLFTVAGQSRRSVWEANGAYRKTGDSEFEFASGAFDGGTGVGDIHPAEPLSEPVREGRLAAGPVLDVVFAFRFEDYTYGSWPFDFQ